MSDPKADNTTTAANATDDDLDSSLNIQNIGVYTIYREKKVKRDSLRSICVQSCKKWKEYLTAMGRLVWEIYTLAPALFIFTVLAQLLHSTEASILLHYETRIMHIIEIGISRGGIDVAAVTQAVGARILSVVIIKGLSVLIVRLEHQLQSRVVHHFDRYLLTCRLGLDMSMLADNLNDDITAQNVWRTSEGIIWFLCESFGLLSQLGFIYHIGRSSDYAGFFIVLCLLKPVLQRETFHSWFYEPRIVEATNPHYLRIQSLKGLVDKQFRSDIMSGNITQYIIDQFHVSQSALGDMAVGQPEMLAHLESRTSLWSALVQATEDLPMVFCAVLAIINPTTTSLSTIFSLRQSSTSLKTSIWRMIYEFGSLEQKGDVAVQLYEMEKKLAQTVVKDGELVYGASDSDPEGVAEKKSDVDVSQGMSLEIRDVSFSYPGGEANAKALDNMSLSIAPGQLVVIVGPNGSGKSTLIKLLSRLYNPSSGEILVDGIDITKYNLASIRQAMAMLTQDHHIYPLSIKENIGLGFAERVHDEEMIMDAARKGGAETVIKRFGEGMKTVLDPKGYQTAYNVSPNDKTPLAAKLKSLKKTGDVSGGEKQRLVAARTFMRFNSGSIKLVAVDEPSSALDPEAELELFNNIRSLREGKTVIFVTHRFGHLTKHADLILCMDKGRVIESGSHSALMDMGGQYCKMYNIQAQAFETKQEEKQ